MEGDFHLDGNVNVEWVFDRWEKKMREKRNCVCAHGKTRMAARKYGGVKERR